MTLGGEIVDPGGFNRRRWARVLGDAELDDAEREFNEMSYEDRVAENQRIASLPDSELGSQGPAALATQAHEPQQSWATVAQSQPQDDTDEDDTDRA